jgi:hypothetical protein
MTAARILLLLASVAGTGDLIAPALSAAQGASAPPGAQTPPAVAPPAATPARPANATARPTATKKDDDLDGIGDRVAAIFKRPVHPTFGSVAPGGGITAGIGFKPAPWMHERLSYSAKALASIRKYWLVETTLDWKDDGPFGAEVFGRLRNMPQLRYYGLGADSSRDDAVNFRHFDRVAGGRAWVDATPWLRIGGRAEHLWPELGAGTKSNLASIETRFDDLTAPGFTSFQSMWHTEALFTASMPRRPLRSPDPDADDLPGTGGDYQVSLGRFDDGGHGTSFRRIEVELQQRFVRDADRRLTLHLFFSDSQPFGKNRVPFHLMRTAGGISQLVGYHETLLGTDETRATLRGFSTFRFRDRSLLVANAEYRFPVRGPVSATVFLDLGNVAPRASDLWRDGVKRSVGFSLSAMHKHKSLIRFDVGFGGGEGIHTFIAMGRGFGF